jgi:F0F1-type ATP synthase alpha subunit
VYVAIRQKHSTVAQLVKILLEADVLEYRIIITVTPLDHVLLQLLAPYSCCVVGEYF